MRMANTLNAKGNDMARSTQTHRIGNIETLESKKLMTADIGRDMVDTRDAAVQVGYEFAADSFSFGVEREMKESGEKGGTEDINIGVGELQECTISKSMDRASVLLAESPGDEGGKDYDDADWFVADSFSFGVEREMKESGEKGGTEDINIGIGELQECTVSKSMDAASGKLAQASINGNSPGTAEIDFVEVAGGGSEGTAEIEFVEVGGDAEAPETGKGNAVGELKENDVDSAMKTWSISGDADDRPTEEVAFYYNKIQV